MKIENFMGKDGFFWWIGVVESRQDPLKLGRFQVRVFATHSPDKNQIPTADLPWAGFSGSETGKLARIIEGTWVWGFFQDGEHCQHPLIVGVMNGIPESIPPITQGFSDQRTPLQLIASPRTPGTKVYNTDGSGVSFTNNPTAQRYPINLNESTISRLARNEGIANTFIQERANNVVQNVNIAGGGTWSEPLTQYAAQYPFNDVKETESGHIMEFDDTPGAERIHLAHRSGTFFEIFPDGTKVEKVVRPNFSIYMSDDNVYVMGSVNITVQGNANLMVMGNVTEEVFGNKDTTVIGDLTETIYGDKYTTIYGDLQETTAGDMNRSVGGGRTESAALSYSIAAPVISTIATLTITETAPTISEVAAIAITRTAPLVNENIAGSVVSVVGGSVTTTVAGTITETSANRTMTAPIVNVLGVLEVNGVPVTVP